MPRSTPPPERRCLVTGAVKPKSELLRFVVDPAGVLAPDIENKLPGRGMWITAERDVLDSAIRRKAFARGARRSLIVDEALGSLVERLLARRSAELLSLANRAGLVVAGYEKVRALVRSGKAAVLVSASDASPAGIRKMQAAADGLAIVSILTIEELSLALGRENVVHAALSRGGLSERFVTEALRLAGFRAQTVTTAGQP